MSTSPIKVFITGAANGLAEVREGLADHPDVELVGTAADPAKAGAKLAESSRPGDPARHDGHRSRPHGRDRGDPRRHRRADRPGHLGERQRHPVRGAGCRHLRRRAAAAADRRHRLHDQEGALAGGRARLAGARQVQRAPSRARSSRSSPPRAGPARPCWPATWPRSFARQQRRAHAAARPRPAVRRRRDHDGHRAGEDDLRPGHGAARARLRRAGRLRHGSPVGRARAPGAAAARRMRSSSPRSASATCSRWPRRATT